MKSLGFTLVEVLVGCVLFMFMGVMLMTSLRSSIHAKEVLEEISGRDQLVRQALSRMAREISMAYLSKHMSPSDPAYVTQFKGKKDQLFFSAFGNVVRQKDAKQGDQQVIGYYLSSDKEGHKSLIRRVRPNLSLDVEKGGVAQVLCPHVTKLEFSYFDNQMNKWQESWIADPTSMPNEQRNLLPGIQIEGQKDAKIQQPLAKQWRLPEFVKISLTADMGQGNEMTWVTETQIPVQTPLDLY